MHFTTTHSFQTGHTFVNIGWNAFVCTTCKLDSYSVDGLECPGTPVVACPTQGNAFSHGQCAQVFATTAEAEAHWMDVHSPF